MGFFGGRGAGGVSQYGHRATTSCSSNSWPWRIVIRMVEDFCILQEKDNGGVLSYYGYTFRCSTVAQEIRVPGSC